MSVVQTQELIADAFLHRYSVPAFNVVDDLSIRAVLEAAEQAQSPVIVETSTKIVRLLGAEYLRRTFVDRASSVSVPASLHLDHCPDRDIITQALDAGFSSVLFDASDRSFSQALAETREVVAEAHRHGATVESEIERIMGIEDDVGTDDAGPRYPLDMVVRFASETGIDYFAPAVGTAHGQYKTPPNLSLQRVTDLVESTGLPQVLHGGTGLSKEDFREMASRGCAKTNVSTALKEAYMRAGHRHLILAADQDCWDPSRLFSDIEAAIVKMAAYHMRALGSEGRA